MPQLLPTQMLLGRECTLEDELIAHAAEEILLTECPWAKLGSKRHLPVTGTESAGRFGGRALRGDALGAGTSIISTLCDLIGATSYESRCKIKASRREFTTRCRLISNPLTRILDTGEDLV
jgi:hypothetical protein